jgi:hypothetical protein
MSKADIAYKILVGGLIVLLSMLIISSTSKADALIVDIGAKSDHLIEGDFNEKNHNWVGVGYRFIEKEEYSVQVKGVSFVNSYYEPTKFVAVTGIYTPIVWKDIKLGITGSVGWQEGYYINKEGTVHPNKAKTLGLSNKSVLVLYSLYGELDNIIVNYTYIPESVQAITIGVKAIEW